MGQLMNASHESMRDDFEISCDELNVMVTCARQQESCYGARMTGGGFGGCAVALVRVEAAANFAEAVAACYQAAAGLAPNAYVCQATDGAKVVRD
jgi:galactokinase